MGSDRQAAQRDDVVDAGWEGGILRVRLPRGGCPAGAGARGAGTAGPDGPGDSGGVTPAAGPRGGCSGGASDRAARLAGALLGLLGRWWALCRPEWTDASWWQAELRDEVRELLWLPAGPALAGALAALPPVRPCPVGHGSDRVGTRVLDVGRTPGWPCACQVIVAAAWQACAGWVAAEAAGSLVDAAGPDTLTIDTSTGSGQLRDPACDELAAALRSTVPAMGNRVAAARSLHDHPTLVALVSTGAISAWAARLVGDHLAGLDPEQADRVVADVEAKVRARLAAGQRAYNSAEVNRLARAARLRICPATEATERARAHAGRRVTLRPMPDGMAALTADLAETDAHRIHRRLTALAAGMASPTDPRTRDQTRADILVDLLLATPATSPTPPRPADQAPATGPAEPDPQAAPAPAAPGTPTPPAPGGPEPQPVRMPPPPGPGPEICVIVSLPTLLGLAADPAHVPGLGPIPPDVARALAADAPWRAWIADAKGAVTAVGARRYTPGPALARLVRAREPRCRFPGCHQPATRCDLDHAVPWPDGPTTPNNLGPLCRRHHNLKTHAGWLLDLADTEHTTHHDTDPPPGWTWHTPAGLTTTDTPDPLPIPTHTTPRDPTPPQHPTTPTPP